MNINDDNRKRALLLHYVGETTHDIYDANKGEVEPDEGHRYNTAKSVLEKIFKPKKNELVAEHEFTASKQKPHQTFDEYITELHQLAKYCSFTNTGDRIRSQLISHCHSSQLRKRVFREPDKYKSLDEVVELGRSMDAADKYSAQIERDLADGFVKAVDIKRPSHRQDRGRKHKKENPKQKYRRDSSKSKPRVNPTKDANTCFKCGREWPHKNPCPAQGSQCNFCGKRNHFEKMCFEKQKGKPVRKVHVNYDMDERKESDSDEYCYGINKPHREGKTLKTPKLHVKLNDIQTEVLVDTGASINIIDQATYKHIGSPKVKRDTGPRLLPYGGGSLLKTLGTLKMKIETKCKYGVHTFHLVEGDYGSLIGFQSASDLELVKIVNKVTDPLKKHPNLFNGVGKLKNRTVKIHIDKTVKPVALRHRRTPFHLRDKVATEIKRLVDEDIIERVEDYSRVGLQALIDCYNSLKMERIAAMAELEEEEMEEEEGGACGGGPAGLIFDESSVNMSLEVKESRLPLSVRPKFRLMIDSSEFGINFEQENTEKSGNRESYLSLCQIFRCLKSLMWITMYIEVNSTVRKYVGYLAVLDVQVLQTLCYPWIEKERNGDQLEVKDQHFLDVIKKTPFLNFIEDKNGAPSPPQQAPNTAIPRLNISALSCLLKIAMVANLTKVKLYYDKLATIPTYFTNLRPVLVGIRSHVLMPSMDVSDVCSLLYWPTGITTTAKEVYNKGFHCLNSALKLIQCRSCGRKHDLRQDSKVDICCTPSRILNFYGRISVANMQTYLESVSAVFHHRPSSHLQPEMENCVMDNFLHSSTPPDVDRLQESGLYPTEVAGTYRCFSCGVLLGNWQRTHDAILRHAAASLHCLHMLNICGPVVIHFLRESLLQAGAALPSYIGQHFVCHPGFRRRCDREQSWSERSNGWRKWPDAGFFFKDQRSVDTAVCFCCGIEVADIMENDDPWAVHYSYQSSCPFLLESRPEYFGMRAGCQQLTREQKRRFAVPTGLDQEAKVASDIRLRVEPILDVIDSSSFHGTENVRSLVDDPSQDQAAVDDLDEEDNRLRVEPILDFIDSSSFHGTENVRSLVDDPSQDQAAVDDSDEEERVIQEENEALKKRFSCSICGDKEVAIAFLPCGHLVCCEDCAPAITACPTCGNEIDDRVRSFLS